MSILNKEIKISSATVRNRLSMAPTYTGRTDGGKVSRELLDYYDERTRGGNVGLVVLEHSFVRPDGIAGKNQLSVCEDSDIDGLARLSALLHANGSLAVMQISHAGAMIKKDVVDCEGISPSGLGIPNMAGDFQTTHAMTKVEISDMVKAFADAALRCKKAGFDGVEIHSAHRYFLNQFYSPLTNRRNDEYGGTLENRIRIHLEVIKAVRDAVGDDFIVGMRLGGSDYGIMEGGATLEDAVTAAKVFEKEGLDFIDLTGGMCGYILPDRSYPGYFSDLGKAVKDAVSIPVILAGGIASREDAESLLESGSADIAAVARAIMKDASFADKVFAE